MPRKPLLEAGPTQSKWLTSVELSGVQKGWESQADSGREDSEFCPTGSREPIGTAPPFSTDRVKSWSFTSHVLHTHTTSPAAITPGRHYLD